jgi:hypothetical protein
MHHNTLANVGAHQRFVRLVAKPAPRKHGETAGEHRLAGNPLPALETANGAQRRAAKQHLAKHFRLRKVQRGSRYERPGHGANIVGLASATVMVWMIQVLLHTDYVHDGDQAFLLFRETGLHDLLHERNERYLQCAPVF